MKHIKMFRAALVALVTVVLTSQSMAVDIFVSPTGSGEKTGMNWSNALNGSNDGWHIDIKNAITSAVDGGAEEVNVYLAAGDYSITNQLALSSITIPVKFSGGYVGETDGSMEESAELKTTLKRNTSYKTRFFEITSLSNLAIDSMSFTGGYLNESAPVGGAIKLTSTTVLIHECVFENNGIKNSKSNHATGGAIAALSSGNLEVINCLFANNYIGQGALSSVSHGGAIYTYKVHCYPITDRL